FFDKNIYESGKGIDWYRGFFKDLRISRSRRLFFESTPSYLYYANAAEKIAQYYPNIKLIVILRDPVARAYSAWNMYHDFYQRSKNKRFLRNLSDVNQDNHIFKAFFKEGARFP